MPKAKKKVWDSLHCLGPIVQVLSTPWADSTAVPCAKFRPWVTVHFAQGTSVFNYRFNLGIHVHTPCTYSR